jgi:hypothetical protein
MCKHVSKRSGTEHQWSAITGFSTCCPQRIHQISQFSTALSTFFVCNWWIKGLPSSPLSWYTYVIEKLLAICSCIFHHWPCVCVCTITIGEVCMVCLYGTLSPFQHGKAFTIMVLQSARKKWGPHTVGGLPSSQRPDIMLLSQSLRAVFIFYP